MNCTEYGWQIGRALDRGKIKEAKHIFAAAIEARVMLSTMRDYSEPLAEVCTEGRVVTIYENCDAVTVEDWFRTKPQEFYRSAIKSNASTDELNRQNRIIEGKYSPSLWGNVSMETVRRLHMANILSIWDVCHTDAQRLANAVGRDPASLRELIMIQRENE